MLLSGTEYWSGGWSRGAGGCHVTNEDPVTRQHSRDPFTSFYPHPPEWPDRLSQRHIHLTLYENRRAQHHNSRYRRARDKSSSDSDSARENEPTQVII